MHLMVPQGMIGQPRARVGERLDLGAVTRGTALSPDLCSFMTVSLCEQSDALR